MSTIEEGSQSHPIAPGQELLNGRLLVLDALGVGSAGVVYRAEDRRLGRHVAIKTLRTLEADRLYQLKREFRTLARLSHPNLVQFYELGAMGDVWFLIMELVDGVELTQWLRTKPTRDRLLRVFIELFEGIRVLHAAGHMHRDLKPSNIMVTRSDRAVLLDFGLATPIRGSAKTMAAGTLDYVAPEQLWSDAPGAAADWHSFGVLLFEALTGQLPFTPEEKLKGRRRPAGPAALVRDIPPPLDDLVRRLLDPEPEQRPDPAEIAAVLGAPPVSELAAPAIPDIPFVGRGEQLDQLRHHLDEARSGQARVVHLHGPSGIGKTALVQHFVADTRRRDDALVLEGACHPQESVPYRALDAVIDNLARHLLGLDERVVVALSPRHAGALLQLFPVLGRVPGVRQWPVMPGTMPPSEIRRRGSDALRELIGKLSDAQPVVLWIDDIQWSDRDSGPVIRALLAPPDAPRLLLVLTSRDGPEGTPLVSAFEDVVVPLEITLGPLTPGESRDVARELSRGVDTPIDLESVARESGGSAFLLGELIRYRGERAHEEPLSVADVVKGRLLHLDADARSLIEVVAVAGRPLEADLAFDVARLSHGGQLVAYALCAQYLLRTGTHNERVYLETYHDRIREAAIANLDPEQRRTRHRDLAQGIRASRNPDARALVKHYLGAGDQAEGAHFALLAAEEAERDLALDQAVEMYDVVLSVRPEARLDRHLLARRALVLANAARRAEAARGFEDAARAPSAADPEERTALRGQAAEQFFYGGELRQGTTVLQEVLGDMGIRVPMGSGRRAIAAQWLRARFMLRGCRVDERDVDDPRTAARLDALWRATRGVVMLDHILADVLGGRHLREALRHGSTSRALRAVALEAAFEANIGGRWFRERSRRLLRESERAAARHSVPYDEAWLMHCRAACHWFEGRWEDCVTLGEAAEARFKAQGVGVAWDLAVLQGFVLSALANLGRLRDLAKKRGALIADAERRQDQYALRVFRTGDAVTSWLVDDQPDVAVRIADESLGEYRNEGFTAQHRHHLVATVQSHLYAGDADLAWGRVEHAWRPARWSGFLFLDCLGTQLRYLRGCAALACARAAPGRRSAELISIAKTEMQRVRRSDLPMAAPMASALEAGIAGASNRRDEQVAALRAARDGFDAADMALYREAARLHLAALVPDGAAIRAQSTAWMTSEGIVRPDAMARALVPPA